MLRTLLAALALRRPPAVSRCAGGPAPGATRPAQRERERVPLSLRVANPSRQSESQSRRAPPAARVLVER